MNQTDIQLENSSGLGKLIMMGVFSLLLCMSILMSVFTPYPIGLSSVLYGRLKASLVAFVALIVCYTLVGSMFQDISIFIFFAFSIAIAFGLAEVVLREVNPISGIIGLGILVTVFSSMVVFISMSSSDKTIKGLLISEFEKIQPLLEEQKKKMQASGEKGSFEVEALLSQPELLAEKVLAEAPSYFFIGVFVMLWANLFLLLKSNRLVKKMNNCKYSETYLLNFKMPDQVIWVVIASLILALWGDQLGTWYPIVGMTLLKTVGVFYFFQGFGIYLTFLDFMKLTGFFRSFLVVITVLTASQLLAFIGLADMFVDFKKLMKRKQDQD